MGHSQVGQVMKWHTKYSLASLDSSMYFSCGLSRVVHLRASREQVANFTIFTSLHQTLTLNPYIKSHKHTGKMIEQNTIKFDTILANKNIVANHNFTSWVKINLNVCLLGLWIKRCVMSTIFSQHFRNKS